jgi:hypothetical protein
MALTQRTYALVRTATGEILYERPDANPAWGTDVGLKWLPVLVDTVGTPADPIANPPVQTIFADRIERVTTLRERTPQEAAAQKNLQATSDADQILAKMALLLVNGLLRAINDQRAAQVPPLAALTRAQFLDYMNGVAVTGSAAPAAAGKVTKPQFITFLEGL